MKLPIYLLLIITTAIVVQAEQESKFQEIIQLLTNNEQQLKAEAQTFSASVADPSSGYPQQGFSRASERSRYTSSHPQPVSNNNNNNDALDEEERKKLEEEEDEKKPDRLALLLAESKFTCDAMKNGYYADESVGCQVFHYCIDGVKHSWQCPENTVFHQIHLNCVPNTQDICPQSSKYHIVNEYLHKELDERGPNNTVLYHQRFYPDGFDYSGGDPVAQIFQAQAQAALLKAQQAHRQPQPVEEEEEEEPVPRPRTRSRIPSPERFLGPPQNQASPPQVRSPQVIPPQQNRPLYRQQINRPLVNFQPPPAPQQKPTSRPISFTSPTETFSPPTYTESPPVEEYSHSHSSDAGPSGPIQSGFQNPNQISPNTFSIPSTQSLPAPASANTFQPSGGSSSSFTSSAATSAYQPTGPSQSSFRAPGSGRTSPNYPPRSLGIPIASFRVAPAASSFSASGSSPSVSVASNPEANPIQDANVSPLISFTSLNDDHNENRQLLSQLFY